MCVNISRSLNHLETKQWEWMCNIPRSMMRRNKRYKCVIYLALLIGSFSNRMGTLVDNGARLRAQIKELAWPMAERKSCLVLSARFPVVNWRSSPVAKSAQKLPEVVAYERLGCIVYFFQRENDFTISDRWCIARKWSPTSSGGPWRFYCTYATANSDQLGFLGNCLPTPPLS